MHPQKREKWAKKFKNMHHQKRQKWAKKFKWSRCRIVANDDDLLQNFGLLAFLVDDPTLLPDLSVAAGLLPEQQYIARDIVAYTWAVAWSK